jgi:hypothetical protein
MRGARGLVYQLPPRVLPAIQAIEGGRSGTASFNRDGSEDLGVMQMNMLWLDLLARHTYLPRETVRERMLDKSYFKLISVGLILRVYLNEARDDLLRAVGGDCLRRPALNQGYKVKVLGAARVMFVARP